MELLLLMIAGHFLADYPLQGDFLSKAKNRKDPIPGVPFWQALTAHAGIHGGMVGILTGSVILGLFEFVFHWLIDDAKCRGLISFNTDQFLHILCKVVWFLLLVLFFA